MMSIFVTLFILTSSVSAIEFPDIQHEKWSWAKSNIEEMTNKQIIMGFPDGTFKPAESVTKLQSLMLVSRIIGYNEEMNKEYVEIAKDIHMSKLQSYDISGKEEIAYLLYKNIITEQELDDYISDRNANRPLKRYDAAILFTKALGMEASVKNQLVPLLVYVDQDDIPTYARPFVKFVRDYGIMQGIDETGPEFGPTLDVSRAQMAVMLYRVIKRNEKEVYAMAGKVTSASSASKILRVKALGEDVKEYDIGDDVLLIVNGNISDLSNVTQDMSAILTFRNEELYMVEALTPFEDRSFSGRITRITNTGGIRALTISLEENGKQVTQEYSLDDNAEVFDVDGKSMGVIALKTQQFAKFAMLNGKIVKVELEDKTKTVSGIIEDIILQPQLEIELKTRVNEIQKYRVADNIVVYRNGRASDLNSVRIGDDATLTLEYNTIIKIETRGSQSSSKGTLEEIVISRTPSIKISANDDIVEYKMIRDVEIRIDGKQATIYDLRLGYPVSLTIDSNNVTAITANSVVESYSITGVVQRVNTAINLIEVLTTDTSGQGVERMIFVKNNTNILNNKTGGKLSLSGIKEGDTVIATGETLRGDFEAVTVLVIAQ
jgi:hypothetical protein